MSLSMLLLLWCRAIVDDVGDHTVPEPLCPLKPW